MLMVVQSALTWTEVTLGEEDEDTILVKYIMLL